jgi:Tfp pilus assembly protein PilZ
MDRFLTEEEISALLELFHAGPTRGAVEPEPESGSLLEHELQRRFFRSSQCLPAVLRVDDKAHQVEVTNFSLGGVFIRCTLELAAGRQVEMELELPCPRIKVFLSGCVCWQKKSTGQATGLGIRFSLLPADAIWAIVSNIEQARNQNPC